MQADRVAFVTPMQEAFMRAMEQSEGKVLISARRRNGKSVMNKVLRALDRAKPHQERAVNARVSYRTAQKLKSEGVL